MKKYEIIYAGLPLHDYLTILNIKRSILPARENFVKDIPAQNGQLYMGYKYKAREITVEAIIKASSKEEHMQNIEELAFILDVNVPTKMIINDEPDRYVYAIIDGTAEIQKLKYNAKFTLKFVCYDPYKYAIEDDLFSDVPLNSSARAITVLNSGGTSTYPILSVSFSKDAHFLQATDRTGRTVLVGTPPSVDKPNGAFDPQVLKDSCEVLTEWTNVGNIIDTGIVEGDLTINGGGYGITCTNFGSSSEGWHGGARRRNLGTNLNDFRVEVKMEHNSKGDLKDTGAGSKPPSSSSNQYIITASPSLIVRSGRGTSYKRLGSYKKGTIVTVTDIQKNWGKVTYNKQTGYICMDYTKKYVAPSTSTSSKYKTTSNLNLRAGRGTNYKILTTISKGTIVTVSDIQNNWGKITYNGKTGYSSMKYLAKVASTKADETTDVASCEDRMGKIEVYGFDRHGTKLFKMSMKDTTAFYEYSEPEIQIGSKVVLDDNKTIPAPKTVRVKDEKDENKTVIKNVDSGKFGEWNEFVGWFTIERKTVDGKQKWKCKVEKLSAEGKVVRKIETATISNNLYPTGELNNIVVWIGQYKSDLSVDVMNVNEIYVTDLSKQVEVEENKPLFQKGDTLIIDFGEENAYLQTGSSGSNVKSMMNYLDVGSDFFECPVGSSQIGIQSDDLNIETDISIKKRWL